MIETQLLEELRKFCAETLRNFRFPAKGGGLAPVVAVSGYLPPKRSTETDDYPFVIVRADSGEAYSSTTRAKVSLIIGCWSEDADGYAWCIEAMTRLRMALISQNCLADRFVLEMPISWSNQDEQPYPQWLLTMTTSWTFRSPEVPA